MWNVRPDPYLLIFLCLAGLACAPAFAAPDPNWTVKSTMNDCSGSAQQQTAGCESYATDFYEHLDYDQASASSADIQAVRAGFDADYYYFEFDFVDPWSIAESTGHHSLSSSSSPAFPGVSRVLSTVCPRFAHGLQRFARVLQKFCVTFFSDNLSGARGRGRGVVFLSQVRHALSGQDGTSSLFSL